MPFFREEENLSSHSLRGGNSRELLQVVDAADTPLCGLPREDVHARKHLHRAVHVLVFNSAGDLYLQRRASTKDTWAGYWDSSCAGHVQEGESYEAAAARELEEELGIRGPLTLVGKLPATEATDLEFVTVYTITSDEEIHPNEEEIDEGRFLSIDQVRLELRDQSRPFTPCFAVVFRLYAISSPTQYVEE